MDAYRLRPSIAGATLYRVTPRSGLALARREQCRPDHVESQPVDLSRRDLSSEQDADDVTLAFSTDCCTTGALVFGVTGMLVGEDEDVPIVPAFEVGEPILDYRVAAEEALAECGEWLCIAGDALTRTLHRLGAEIGYGDEAVVLVEYVTSVLDGLVSRSNIGWYERVSDSVVVHGSHSLVPPDAMKPGALRRLSGPTSRRRRREKTLGA
jgi:hypothetical protein